MSVARKRYPNFLKRIWGAFGPGIVTGAADDDPSGIATYSQAGAQFGYSLTWAMFLTLPFMIAIQIISGCIGWKTKKGLAANLATRIRCELLYFLVTLLVVANTINIAADLAAMGEALALVIGGYPSAFAILFGAFCALAEIIVPYHRYANFLKATTFVLFFYVATAFTINVPWQQVLQTTLLPHITFDRGFLTMILAVFGTTISPYLFFWQACQEAEEAALFRFPHQDRVGFFSRISIDTTLGMALSNVVAFFIIVTTAATLRANGITQIQTAAQAAEALRPLAGEFTFFLFALGIIGTGLLAVPVLAGSAAYAVSETFGMTGSLELPATRAIGFYAVISTATLVGAGLAAAPIDPITFLFWAAVINGVISAPIMLAMMTLVSVPSFRSTVAIPFPLLILGWTATGLMAATTTSFGISLL